MKFWSLLTLIPCLLVLVTQSGCAGLKEPQEAQKSGDGFNAKAENNTAVDVSFLLSMDYNEARVVSAHSIEFPPFYKVAADSIEVTKTNPDGTPRRLRAKGRVFIEMNYNEPAKALCQELLLRHDEVILRGKPVLQRGSSTVEGVDDYTVFYMFGSKLRVIGMHRLVNPDQMMAGTHPTGFPTLDAWTNAPNPLLPPLTESDVPAQVRAELQRAAEAEMLHQQTRSVFGPVKPETKPEVVEPKERKHVGKKKDKH
jgi:hypothetical protein